jgi:hypothetical protein
VSDHAEDDASPADRFWYQVVWRLGTLQEIIFRERIKEPVWRSYNGTVHTPRTMADGHLYNMVQLCLRRQADGKEPLPLEFPAFQAELQRRKGQSKFRAVRARATHAAIDGGVAPAVDPEVVRLLAQHMLSEAKAKAQAAMVLGDEHCCMVCGAKPPNPLSPWIPNEPATLRCSDAKGCQSRMINGKLAMLAEIP